MISGKLLSYINSRYFINLLNGIYIYKFFTYFNDMTDKINCITKNYTKCIPQSNKILHQLLYNTKKNLNVRLLNTIHVT